MEQTIEEGQGKYTLKRKMSVEDMQDQPAKKTYEGEQILKFLIPSQLVGSVIGRGGETIAGIKAQSETSIHVSSTSEYFPGTKERICTIQGKDMKAILTALHLLISKISEDDAHNSFNLRLIVPKRSCGALIGKGGAVIKSIIDETECNVNICDEDSLPCKMAVRLVTVINQEIDKQIKAVALLLQKAIDESDYSQNLRFFRPHELNHLFVESPFTSKFTAPIPDIPQITASMTTTATLFIPDEYVGSIIGKGGAFINQVKASTGAEIKISDRMNQESRRKVQILGSEKIVSKASAVIIDQLKREVKG